MHNNNMPYYPSNIQYSNFRAPARQNDRLGGFLFPFALGFVSSPLLFGATRPRPYYYPYPRPYYYPYY